MSLYINSFIYYWILLRSFVIPNICSYTENAESVCCQGWVKNVYGDCIKSECTQDCGYGKCVGLNICECYDGSTRSDSCSYPKENSCPDNCLNRGKCQNGKCICDSGYSGLNCNSSIVSTCYVKVNRGLCKTIPDGIKLTKEECCSIFQMAWGNPCEFCNGANTCGKGYLFNNGRCEDIDECRINGMCLNGQCVNEPGSFRCQCPPKHVLNEDTMVCQQYKEICDIYVANCGAYGICVPLITGDYKCICRDAYEVSEDGKRCKKRKVYNVCKMFTNLCQPHGDCQPSGMSYYCKCQRGFIQTHDRKSCRIDLISSNTNNEDPCRNLEVSQRCTNGQCISDLNGYRCLCYYPFKASADSQECVLIHATISPIDGYCQKSEYYSRCQGGQCLETSNGYYCKCLSDYISKDNGRQCERSDTNGNPGRNPDGSSTYCRIQKYAERCKGGRCIGDQTFGFRCLCLPGFVIAPDGRACYPVRTDACEINDHKCASGTCIGIGDNDFQCECPSHMVRSQDGRSCSLYHASTQSTSTYCDIPMYRARCATGQCVPDSYYGFKCICTTGYIVSADGRACERTEAPDPCNGHKCVNGRCIPMGESDYRCDCPNDSLRSQDGRSCLSQAMTTISTSTYCDIARYRERCLTGQCIIDNYYGFKCICSVGYTVSQDGRACHKIESTESICSKYRSRCNGGRCIELNNYEYECQCKSGQRISSDRRSCEDDTQSLCGLYGFKCLTGQCLQRGDQSYVCRCDNGYYPIDDARACAKNPSESICSRFESRCVGGKCIELQNSNYECECGRGYHNSIDGKSCVKDLASVCDTYGYKCLTGVCYTKGNQDYFCLCPSGYTAIDDSKACVKNFKVTKSQCTTYGFKCKGNVCIDKINDYKCVCMPGYVAADEERSCEKSTTIERCAQFNSRCRDGFCFDIAHGYLCICSSNYVVTQDGRYCSQDERIVLRTNTLLQFPLLSTTSNADCSKKDFKHTCSPGTCVNTNYGYGCECPYSFKISSNRQRCKRDKKQCPHCYHGCKSPQEGSECLCPADFKDLFETGLCIRTTESAEYALTEYHCNLMSLKNRTFVIQFKGVPTDDKYLSSLAQPNVQPIIQQKQQKSAKLNFCVPTRKRNRTRKPVRRNTPSATLLTSDVVCIFDC